MQYLTQFRAVEEDLKSREEKLKPLKQALRAATAAVTENANEIARTTVRHSGG